MAGAWDERRETLIVLYQDPLYSASYAPSWSPETFAALRDNYRLLYRDAMFTYVPR